MKTHSFRPAQIPYSTPHDACNNAISDSMNIDNDAIIVIRFIRELDLIDEASVIIDSALNLQLIIGEVIEEGEGYDEFNELVSANHVTKVTFKRNTISDYSRYEKAQ